MTTRGALAAALAGLLLPACVGGGAPAEEEAAAVPSQAPAPRSQGPGSEEPTRPDGADDPHGELACDDDVADAIDETIAAQLAAFADDDFGRALGLASQGFQAGLDVDGFRRIIEQDYPVVADAVDHTSGLCVAQDDAAQLLVTVEGSDGTAQELVYTMALEDDGWRIDGAQVPPGAPTTAPIV